jgi:serine/threonine protein kinase
MMGRVMGTEADSDVRRVGRYEVELLLGDRPLDRVFVARDPVLGRRVVVKILRRDLSAVGLSAEGRSRLVERIRGRARAFASLSHPVFVALHDMGDEAGEHDGGGGPADLYLVFEFIKGPTLSERLAGGPLAPAEVATFGRALGAGLTFAHAAGFVHGDVKPDNVMLALPGPKLTDPGFAEIARERVEAPDPFDDQLALARTLYEALTGKPPAEGTARLSPSALAPHLRSFPHLDTIFDRALAENPRKRFTSCEVLGNVLAHEIEGADASTLARASASSIVPRATRRWQNGAAAAAVLVIVALVLLGRPQPLPPPAFPAAGSASSPVPAVPPRPRPARPDAGTLRPPASSDP